LKIVTVTASTGNPPALEIRFNAVANRTYTLQTRADSPAGIWENLQPIPAPAQTGVVTVIVPAAAGSNVRFYRIVTPAQP